MTRIIVTGWRDARDWQHRETIEAALYPLFLTHELAGDVTLVHGKCHLGGVDLIAHRIAENWGWTPEPHPAIGHPTQDFGPWPGAGPKRNRYMCSLGADLVIAFPGPGSKGTWDCLQAAAMEYGIPGEVHPLGVRGA